IAVAVVFLSITKRAATELVPIDAEPPEFAHVLVVAQKTAATLALMEAIRQRAERGPARFHLLVPNPARHAEITDAERQHHHTEGGHILALALPLIDQAAGTHAEGSVSIRHDPMDAIEEALDGADFREIIVSTLPHSVSRWLHADLPRRVARLGLPVTTVTAEDRDPSPLRRRETEWSAA